MMEEQLLIINLQYKMYIILCGNPIAQVHVKKFYLHEKKLFLFFFFRN